MHDDVRVVRLPAEIPRLGRREIIQMLAMSAGGLLSFPLVASSHPIQRHFRDASSIGAADANAAAREYSLQFLNSDQFATLQTLAERIVPGSAAARSGEFIDQLLGVADAAERRRFAQALERFDALARARVQGTWTQLTEDQQNELLIVASTEKAGPNTIRDEFEHLKGWIVGAYYSSERGMRELGWTGRTFFPSLPGCDHHDGH
jgi:hypothetical protein